jgi:hypothetical protein
VTITVTREQQAAMERLLLGGGLGAWWGRSSVRLGFAVMAVALAPAVKALGGAAAPALAAVVCLAVPALVMTGVFLVRRRVARATVRGLWPVGVPVGVDLLDGRLSVTAPDGVRAVDLSDVRGVRRADGVLALRLRDREVALPAGALDHRAESWLSATLLARRTPGFEDWR